MRRAWAWLKALYSWLAEARLVWLALLLVAPAVIVSLREGASEWEIRIAGLVLQLFGLGTVAHGVHKTRKLFGRPSTMASLRGWATRFPRWRRSVVLAAGTAVVQARAYAPRIWVWSSVEPGAPIEAQIKALSQNVEHLKVHMNQTEDAIDAGLRKQSDALGREEQARANSDSALQQRLELAQTGGLEITFVGVIWLAVGVILATIAPDIAQWRS